MLCEEKKESRSGVVEKCCTQQRLLHNYTHFFHVLKGRKRKSVCYFILSPQFLQAVYSILIKRGCTVDETDSHRSVCYMNTKFCRMGSILVYKYQVSLTGSKESPEPISISSLVPLKIMSKCTL